MNTRNWSIRSKITALVAVPLSALLALWVFATALTIGPALNLLSARALLDDVGKPGEALVAQLQQERRISVVYLSGRGDDRALTTQRAGTDAAVAAFLTAADSGNAQRVAGSVLRSRINEVATALEGLADGRDYIERRQVDAAGAHNLYSSLIDGVFRMFSATGTYGEPQIDRETRALNTISRAREWLSQADSLLAGAHTAGVFSGDDHGKLIQAIGTQQYLYGEAVADLPAKERAAYQRLAAGDAFVRLQQLQDILVRSSAPGVAPPVPADQWQPAYDSVVQQLRAFEINATEAVADRAAPVAVEVLLRLALAGLLGLIALVVSIVVSLRVGRSLIGRLARLRVALDTAGEQLPQLVRRMRLGDEVDVEAESPAPDYGTDEIGRLGQAFSKVRRIAVQSAVDEAGVRRGINEVFLNIARRSQTLLHRQLSLLDKMERRETDPQELEDLYRVDHLATRMRRHAEDLVILAGAAPGRGWRNPVPVVDVVRGAISEVEDYKRIDVSGVETSSLVGRAVGDVIHLLAELLENATSFSPPNTRVQVAGQVVPNGYVIEIEDRGLGMPPEALDEANRRLLEPPEFDPADSARLGLFVVAKLASRHRIRVQLRSSPYGGVTAVALIKAELITAGSPPAALPAGPTPAGPTPAGPTPAGPTPAGPTPIGSKTGTPAIDGPPRTGDPMTPNAPDAPSVTDAPFVTEVPDQWWDRPAVDASGADRARLAGLRRAPREQRPVRPPVELPDEYASAIDVPLVDVPLTDGSPAPAETAAHEAAGYEATSYEVTGYEAAPAADAPAPANGLAQRRRGVPRPRSAPHDIVSMDPAPAPMPAGHTTAAPFIDGSIASGPFTDTSPALAPIAGPTNAAPAVTAPPMNVDPAVTVGTAGTLPGDETRAHEIRANETRAHEIRANETRANEIRADDAGAGNAGPDEAGIDGDAVTSRLGSRAVEWTDPVIDDVADTVVVVRRKQIPIGEDGLPRRVRQANLIPQLRQPVEPERQPVMRSPEQVRSLMSALQRGTTQGRLAAGVPAPEPDAPVRPAPVRPAPKQTAAPERAAMAYRVGWNDGTTAGYPRTRDPAGAAAAAETIVHYGEIVPRRATDSDGPVPSESAYPSRVSGDGDMTQPEKDT